MKSNQQIVNDHPQLYIMEEDMQKGEAVSIEQQYNGIRRARKELEYFPAPFPKDDESWKDMFDIKRYNKKVHLYKDGSTGRTLYAIARRDFIDESGKKGKQITPFSYCEVNGFVNKNFHSDKSHFLHEDKFPTFNPSSSRDLLWCEGETTCDKAQELFPNYVCTTASGGVQSIKNIKDLSVLRDFRTITMWHDNNAEAQGIFLEVAQNVQDMFKHIDVKIVDLPKELPNDWDLANKVPNGINVYEVLRDATNVNDYESYNNLKRDVKIGRWKYLKKQNLFYDMLTGDELAEKNINNLYLRDSTRNGLASKELNRGDNAIEVVQGYIFSQSKDRIVKKDNKKYINTRKSVSFPSMSAQEIAALKDDPEIKRMLDHFWRLIGKDDFLYRHFLSTVASDVQHPEANRTWTVVICSFQGTGKTWAWRLFTEFNGKGNTEWLDQEEIYDKYRDWIPRCDMVVIDELRWDPREKNKFISKMKMLVTGERHRTESKYKDAVNFYGHYKFWLSSNNFVPFDCDPEERRHHIIHNHQTWRQIQDESGDRQYYKKLWGLLYNDPSQPEKMNYEFIRKAYWFFMNHEIDYNIFSLTECPETKAKQELKDHAWTQDERDLHEFYLKKEAPFNKKAWSAESVLKKVRELKETNSYYRSMFNGLKLTDITHWFKEKMKMQKINQGNILQLGDDTLRRNYWSDDDKLIACTDLRVIREIYNGKDVDPRQNILNFEDKKDDRETKGIEDVPF